jgi:hypothetical protein
MKENKDTLAIIAFEIFKLIENKNFNELKRFIENRSNMLSIDIDDPASNILFKLFGILKCSAKPEEICALFIKFISNEYY